MLRRIGPLSAAVVVLLAAFQITADVPEGFLSRDNVIDLCEQISVNAILAFGMTLVILIRGIDLSVGRVVALVGTVTAFVLSQREGQVQSLAWVALAMACGLSVAGAVGAFNGVCAARTRMPPFIITLATMWVAKGAALRLNSEPIPIPAREEAFLWIGTGRLLGAVPVPIVIMLVVFAACTVLLHQTRFGQHLYAMGGNREAARFTGIPLASREVAVYVICSLLAGVAGMIHAAQLYSAEPGSGEGFELDAIAAAVVGGTSLAGGSGTMYGTLIGAVIIGILDKGLNQTGVHYSLKYIVKGLVVLAAVYVDVRRRK